MTANELKKSHEVVHGRRSQHKRSSLTATAPRRYTDEQRGAGREVVLTRGGDGAGSARRRVLLQCLHIFSVFYFPHTCRLTCNIKTLQHLTLQHQNGIRVRSRTLPGRRSCCRRMVLLPCRPGHPASQRRRCYGAPASNLLAP